MIGFQLIYSFMKTFLKPILHQIYVAIAVYFCGISFIFLCQLSSLLDFESNRVASNELRNYQ